MKKANSVLVDRRKSALNSLHLGFQILPEYIRNTLLKIKPWIIQQLFVSDLYINPFVLKKSIKVDTKSPNRQKLKEWFSRFIEFSCILELAQFLVKILKEKNYTMFKK